jgi:hypothetical protein
MPDENAPETTELDTSKVVPPPSSSGEGAKGSSETPIFDEVADELEVPEIASSYKADVKRALARDTDDGYGDEDPGPSNFESFATEGVEVEKEANE